MPLSSEWASFSRLATPSLIALGATLGFFGGVFGIGGGILAIPLLVLGFDLPQPLAQGTALVMMVPNLVLGWWRYQQRHPLPWPMATAIALPATLTTALAAALANALAPATLRAVFGIFLAALAWQQWRRKPLTDQAAAPPALAKLSLVGVAGGSSMGLLGIGGGLLATPLLTGLLGLRQTMAQSLSLALVVPSSMMALGTYTRAGRVDWPLGLALAAGGLFTVSAGVRLAHRLPERRLRQSFSLMLAATGFSLAVVPFLR